MRIREFFIKRYGPLRDKSYTLSDHFNLFFGRNEDGKTLTIDALVKLLLGRNIRDFERIDRVDENPEGYLVVEDDQGQEVKLPEKGILTKLAALTPSECRNLFVIRNSDLSISPESEFYTSVTDRLIGVKTEEISRIIERLRETGKITPSGSFRDTKDEKLKTKIENAAHLLRKIETVAREIKEGEYDKLEEEAASCKDERGRLTHEIENLEEARKREKYEKGREALTSLKESLARLRDLQIYSVNAAQLWRDCERDIQRLEEEKRGLEKVIEREETELKRVGEGLNEEERGFRVLEEIKSTLDKEVRQDLSNYERDREQFELKKERTRFLSLTWIASAILLGICLAGIILKPTPVFFISAGLLLVAAVLSWILNYQFIRYKASLEGAFERIKLILSKCELGAGSIDGIFSNIQRFDIEYRRKNEELQNTRRTKENFEGKIGELRHRVIPEVERKIGDATAQIEDVMMQSNQKTLEEYIEKLRLREKLEKSAGEAQSVLESHFGAASRNLERNIGDWEREISALEAYRDSAVGIVYTEDALLELEKEKQQLDEKLEEMTSRSGSFQRAMGEIERKVNEILRLEKEYLYCKTSVDLEAVRKALERFVHDNETRRDNVLRAMLIFEEIEREEKEKVAELFDTESPILEYFSRITGGLYEEVALNQGIGQIEVKRADGTTLGAEKLSGGAYDQLYLSIRLALGEKLLEGKKGFFIMDDPFIKADPDRLHRQIEMLKRISEAGWQIVYFSAKEEIENALREDVKKGNVNRIEIQGMLS